MADQIAPPAASPAPVEVQPGMPQPEAAPAAQPPPTPDPLAQARAELERRDRELLERQGEFRAREDQVKELAAIRELAGKNPLQALRQLGADPVRVAEEVLAGPREPTADDRIAEVGGKLQTIEQQQLTLWRQGEINTIAGHMQALGPEAAMVRTLAAEDPRIYDDLMGAAQEQYQRTGKPPNYTELLRERNKTYTDNLFSRLPHVAALFSNEQKQQLRALLGDQEQGQASQAMQPPPSKGITGQLAGESGKELRRESEEEADRAFAEAIRGIVARTQRP